MAWDIDLLVTSAFCVRRLSRPVDLEVIERRNTTLPLRGNRRRSTRAHAGVSAGATEPGRVGRDASVA